MPRTTASVPVMSSKSQRRRRRARQRSGNRTRAIDPHARIIFESIGATAAIVDEIGRENDPAQAAIAKLNEVIDEVSAWFSTIAAVRVIEVARLACLPWSTAGESPIGRPGADGGPTRAEVISLLALAAPDSDSTPARRDPIRSPLAPDVAEQGQRGPSPNRNTDLAPSPRHHSIAAGTGTGSQVAEHAPSPSVQPITNMVNEALPRIERILQLAQASDLMTTAEVDPLTLIAARMRGNEVWVRNTSYPDMVARTVRQLFSPEFGHSLSA